MSFSDGRDVIRDAKAALGDAARDGAEAAKNALSGVGESKIIGKVAYGAGVGTEIAATATRPLGKLGGGIKKAAGKGLKGFGLVAGAIAAVGALTYLSNKTRQDRRFKVSDIPDEPLNDIPPVMTAQDFVPAAQQQTLMGQPLVEGPRAQAVKMERTGLSGGINPSSPGLGDIDGKPVKDLGQSPAV